MSIKEKRNDDLGCGFKKQEWNFQNGFSRQKTEQQSKMYRQVLVKLCA